jgi:hypothetical protein
MKFAIALPLLFLKFAEHLVGIQWVDEKRDIDHLIHVDDRREPARRQKARVRNDEEGTGDFFSEVELFGIDLKCVRRDDILEVKTPAL